MPRKSFADQISNAQVMLSGLQGNTAIAERRGIDVALLSQLITSATSLNSVQEKLKADLKSKTAELNALLAELDKEMAVNKKIVKSDIPKEQWKEFGITDKR